MRSKTRTLLAFVMTLTPLGASLPGCSQHDNPTPVAAAPPPSPKPEELKVPKKKGGQVYGANAQYQKAMLRLNKGGS
jgi:hypothetical protein